MLIVSFFINSLNTIFCKIMLISVSTKDIIMLKFMSSFLFQFRLSGFCTFLYVQNCPWHPNQHKLICNITDSLLLLHILGTHDIMNLIRAHPMIYWPVLGWALWGRRSCVYIRFHFKINWRWKSNTWPHKNIVVYLYIYE